MSQGVAEGDGVDEFEAGAGGDAGGEAGDLGAGRGQLLGEEEGGGFTPGVRSETENHLADLVLFGPPEQGGDFQFFRSDSVQRREESAQNVVLPLQGTGAFEVKDIRRVFDDAQQSGVAVLVPADLTGSLLAKKTAFLAGLHLSLGLLDGVGEIL